MFKNDAHYVDINFTSTSSYILDDFRDHYQIHEFDEF